MKILPEPLSFGWDQGNINKNLIRHNVSNQEAEEIFADENILTSEDIKHSNIEKRFQALGKTKKGRLLFASFTLRKEKIGIISTRDASKKERFAYEKTKINTKI